MDEPDVIEAAVIRALNRGAVEKKYVDVGRIPFICDDIRGIHDSMKDLKTDLIDGFDKIEKKLEDRFVTKDSFWPVRLAVFGAIALLANWVITTFSMKL